MDKIRVIGGTPLNGSVEVSGAKNAALPLLFSALLTEDQCTFRRLPHLQDIKTTLQLLEQMGVETSPHQNGQVQMQAKTLNSLEAPYDLVRKMRASVIVLGPLLARFGYAKVSLPGGCAIGARPINFHLTGFEKLGAKITLEGGYVIAECKRLKGAQINFEFPSVGATENIMMAATLAEGISVLKNCAKEPEIIDLAKCLRQMGAKIEGGGTETITIEGVQKLGGCDFEIMGDRIEAGTYLAAGLATGGKVRVTGISPTTLEAVLEKFAQAGATVLRGENWIEVASNGPLNSIDIKTLPFPGFPTDMQAQLMAMPLCAQGTSVIEETVFENRFMHVPELIRLGADIVIKGNSSIIRGCKSLVGAPLMATDLRASASLLIAGLIAEGETIVNRIYHLDRGYERIEEKLRSLGARIERVK